MHAGTSSCPAGHAEAVTFRLQRPMSHPPALRRRGVRGARGPLAVAALGTVLALSLAACGGAEVTAASETPASSGATQSETPSTSSATSDPSGSDDSSPSGTKQSGKGEQSEETQEPTPEPAPVVPEALQFQATTVSGDAFDGASVAGRPVVLWFWAPWCAVCKSQVPTVTGLADQYGDDVAFVGVGGLDGTDAIRAFADDVPGLTHLSDPGGDLYQRFGISEQSSFVVLDAAGGEALRTGYADDDALSAVVADVAG